MRLVRDPVDGYGTLRTNMESVRINIGPVETNKRAVGTNIGPAQTNLWTNAGPAD